jgi:hypothetical protein
MSCWRAAFAMRLRSHLFGHSQVRWTAALAARVARNQCVFAGFKLWLLPLAGLAVLPLPWIVAFFRSAAVYSDLSLPESAARARKLAGFGHAVNVVGILILSGLAVLVFVNMALALAMLPHLAKTFTGVESTYTRSGLNLVLQPLFFLTAALCTWLAIDPLVQAYYTVQCFRGDSLESGADLCVRLVVLHKAAKAAALVLMILLAGSEPLRAQVTADEIDRAVQRTLLSKEYDWRLPAQPAGSSRDSWVVTFTDRMVERAREGLRTLADWIDRLIKWLQGSKAPPPRGNAPGSELIGGLYLLTALVLAGGAFALWRMRARRRQPATQPAVTPLAVNLGDESLTADRLPEEEWYALAEQCLHQSDLRAALRALFLGNLAWLQSRQLIAIHHGKTNREYERELRRRGRAAPEASPLLSENIDAFERAWYGLHSAEAADIDNFRTRLARMKELIPA